jgi:hypothetical protein
MTESTDKIYKSAGGSVIQNSVAEKQSLKGVVTPPAALGQLDAVKSPSTDKYYANNSGVPKSKSVVVDVQEGSRSVSGRISTLTDKSQLSGAITDIVGLLSSGVSPVSVPITEDLVSQLRTSLEVRVGSEEITREQYNDIAFEVLAQQDSEPEVKEPEDKECCPDCNCDPCECAHEEEGTHNCPAGESGEPGEPGEKDVDDVDDELTALEAFLMPVKEISRGSRSVASELNPGDLADLFSGETAITIDDDDDDDDE